MNDHPFKVHLDLYWKDAIDGWSSVTLLEIPIPAEAFNKALSATTPSLDSLSNQDLITELARRNGLATHED